MAASQQISSSNFVNRAMNPNSDSNCKLDFATLRNQVIGADATVATPFGDRLMVYADYTASGRCLGLVERYIQNLQRVYANTHTEDDISGRSMTHLLEQAEGAIKQSVNAGPDGCIVCVGSGATGAIDKLQQIIGVALPPATRQKLTAMLTWCSWAPTSTTQTRFPGGRAWPP
jgi:selenocysteine lyase/cysteine desulfurase